MVLVSVSTAFLSLGDTQKVEAAKFTAESHMFHISSPLNGLTALSTPPSAKPVYSQVSKTKKAKGSTSKFISKKVKAVNLDGKLLVIKGYVENGTGGPESEISIDELNALALTSTSTATGTEALNSSSGSTGAIVSTEIVVGIPPLSEEDISLEEDGDIEEYVVQSGDTLASISTKFNISIDTILWANNLKKNSVIAVGQKLVILPTTGVAYTIKRGDTVSEIAAKFDVSQSELIEFNDLEDGRLVLGERIIIPGGTLKITATVPGITTPKNVPKSSTKETTSGYFSRPVNGGRKSQGIHGHNGIDIAGPIGLPILAARAGTVTLVRGGSGWNGGYGNYVVVTHENGIKTLYAHMNTIKVNQGERVGRGEQVGTLGNTGRSTGPHLHFEVRGAKNPF